MTLPHPCMMRAEGEKLEMLLAIGATRMEALQGIVKSSLQAALAPPLNQLSVIGLVSLPEFFSGQLVFGAGPLQASLPRFSALSQSFIFPRCGCSCWTH